MVHDETQETPPKAFAMRPNPYLKGPLRKENDQRTHRRTHRQIDKGVKKAIEDESQIFTELARCFTAALGHATRMQILAYCLQPRSFSDIMLTLRINPASLKYHETLLRKSGLISKKQAKKGTTYQTTELGIAMLNVIDSMRDAIEFSLEKCT